VEVNGEYPQHPGCVPSSMYPEDPGTPCRGKIVSPTSSWWEDRGCKPYPR